MALVIVEDLLQHSHALEVDEGSAADSVPTQLVSRERFFFKQQNPNSVPCQIPSTSRAGRAGADNRYIVLMGIAHPLLPLKGSPHGSGRER